MICHGRKETGFTQLLGEIRGWCCNRHLTSSYNSPFVWSQSRIWRITCGNKALNLIDLRRQFKEFSAMNDCQLLCQVRTPEILSAIRPHDRIQLQLSAELRVVELIITRRSAEGGSDSSISAVVIGGLNRPWILTSAY